MNHFSYLRTILLQSLIIYLSTCCWLNASIPWCAYYADVEPAEAFISYDVIVFDSWEHPSINLLNECGKTVLGYLNAGEVDKNVFYFKELQAAHMLLETNPDWKDAVMIDLRNPQWARIVIEKLIPMILNQGFQGIMLDTLDNAEYLEDKDPKKYFGMVKAAVNLVKAIRLHYPNIKIMMNRAYALLPKIGSRIDMLLAEDLFSDYNFQTKQYFVVPRVEHEETLQTIFKAKKANPSLILFSLDYWYLNDMTMIKKIYDEERTQGFNPYVSDIQLNKLVPEPK